MRKVLHERHKGIGSTRRLAQESVYWPGISSDIKDTVGNCRICASIQLSQAKEPMQPQDVPSGPWQKVGMDYFELDNKPHIVMVDYYSNWIEIDPVSSMSVNTLITVCRKHFCRRGIPLIVMSDSGSQFKSSQFREFANK
uniref:uncharacterized protein K02A2.6-like n=1 Tax=Styela clava TaxID=7725 RepID=UPI00193ADBFC|nr:uncharacterized protein K02A2.6-like [Styela clava]